MGNVRKKISKPSKSIDHRPAINNLLSNFEFSDTQYIDCVKTYAENFEMTRNNTNELSKSICVSSYVNDTKYSDETGDAIFGSDTSDDSAKVKSQDTNGNIEKSYPDGRKEIWYPNGNVKKISSDGGVVKTIYYNGDVKEILTKDGIIKYFYAESKTWHSQYENGLEVIEFPE